ncbi:PspA/IM30 family protein [Paenibacillus rhizovicinus]|uniref:PspA/IM30 family protein n=1 Tax=Paenibacillus rhizovicinus TaxID=2704463 RepID=A0A6C0P074_9BACL|nr:PspA/IM30 family protein [Paenibacillus rhizovicinus]QHW31894.1 PspA/IM30 family protein [Paenibacillus rhizovicinus]
MGILSRFRDVMKANMNGLLDRAEDPEQAADAYMRSLSSDLGQVKAETASVLAEESRAKRALDECGAEIAKLQRYAEKSVESGDDANGLKFLTMKTKQTAQCGELQAAYDRASAKAAMMKHMQDKLVADAERLEARQAELKGKLADAKARQQANAGGANAAFGAMEEKASLALNEALALAELRAGTQEDDLDTLIAQLEKNAEAGTPAAAAATSAEDELAAMKERRKPR